MAEDPTTRLLRWLYARVPPRTLARGCALFALAWGLRLAYQGELAGSLLLQAPVGDGRAYDLWGQRLAGLRPGEEEVFFQAPFYPYFLAGLYRAFGRDLERVRLVQATVAALGCLALAAAGRRWASPRAGWLGGLLLALYPLAIYYDGLIQKTSLAVSLLCFSLAAAARAEQRRAPGALLACGACLGALSLLRENAAALVPLVAMWLALGPAGRPRARRAGDAALCLLGTALALTPAAWHNHTHGGGGLLPTTFQFGVNLYIGNRQGADGTYAPLEYGFVGPGQERIAAVSQAEAALGHPLTPAEVSRYWTRRTLEEVRQAPRDWLALLGRKWLLTWNDDELIDSESHLAYREESHLLAGLLPVFRFGALLALACWGLVATWPPRRPAWLAPAAALLLAGTLTAFFVFGRYRMLLVPPLALLAGVGLDRLRGPWPPRRRLAASLALGLGAALAALPLAPAGRDPVALTWHNLGSALAEDGRLEQAEGVLRRAQERAPDPVTLATLGEVLFRLRRPAESAAADAAALAGLPPEARQARARVALRLGAALAALGRYGEALAPLEEARRLDPQGEAGRLLEEVRRAQAGPGR